jgi:hypothetical protein
VIYYGSFEKQEKKRCLLKGILDTANVRDNTKVVKITEDFIVVQSITNYKMIGDREPNVVRTIERENNM